MTRHPRIPALAAVLCSAAAGLGILAGTGQFRATDLDNATLPELEKKIAGSSDAKVWCAYGNKLRESGKFVAASKAYDRALDFQPDLVEARINAGAALAQARDADAFFAYFNRLAMSYPKVAVNLLSRPEVAPMRQDIRWEPAAAAAQAQAAD